MTVANPGPVPPAKKTSPLVWVAVGCGAIVLVGLIALAAAGWFAKKKIDEFAENPTMTAAELMVRANPDLELVSKDEDAQTLTVRNKETGEEMTFNAADAKEGRFTFTTKEGTVTMDADGGEEGGSLTVTDDKGQESVFSASAEAPEDLPDWVPVYPGGTTQGSYDATTAEGHSVAFSMTTQDPSDKVIAFYEEKLKAAGLTVQKTTYESNGTTGGTVTGTADGDKRMMNVIVSSSTDGTQAVVTVNEKQ